MSRIVFVIPVLVALPLLTGCASSGGSVEGQTGLRVIGDEKGGSIPSSVGVAGNQSSAFEMVTAHCAKFGKKGFITKMDFEGALGKEVVVEVSRARDHSRSGLIRMLTLPGGKVVSACPQNC